MQLSIWLNLPIIIRHTENNDIRTKNDLKYKDLLYNIQC
jgi:hypothetical protein